jgi:hypothetical protein
MSTSQRRSAVLVVERSRMREIAQTIVEPLTLALALLLGVFGALGGWHAHEQAMSAHAPLAADRYVEALCRDDVAYLRRKTGDASGPMPWEPRLSTWTKPCTGHRYLGPTVDLIGRDQYVFALLRPDGTEAVYVITFGRDGLVAGVD